MRSWESRSINTPSTSGKTSIDVGNALTPNVATIIQGLHPFDRSNPDDVAWQASQSEVLLAEPLRHQAELAGKRLTIIRGELGGGLLSAHLNVREHLECIAVQVLGIIPGIEPGEVMSAAEVLQQQQAFGHVALVHVRNVHADRFQQIRDLQIRPHILFPRRRVHHNVGLPIVECAEVAPEARIGGGGLDALGMEPEIARQPIVNQRESRVLILHTPL